MDTVGMAREHTADELRADIASLRRTAIWSRANGQISVGIELEAVIRRHEARLAEMEQPDPVPA